MSLYAVSAYNHVFSKAAALSPTLYFGTSKVLDFIKLSHMDSSTMVYMDYGSKELEGHKAAAAAFKKVYNALLDGRVMVCARIVPNGMHCEASWEKQIPVFMRCLEME